MGSRAYVSAGAAQSKRYAESPAPDEALTATPSEVFDGPGNLYGFWADNKDAPDMWLVFFDKATAPVPGTDKPKASFKVAPASGFGASPDQSPLEHFSSKCWVVASTSDDGQGALTTKPVVQIWYEAKGS